MIAALHPIFAPMDSALSEIDLRMKTWGNHDVVNPGIDIGILPKVGPGHPFLILQVDRGKIVFTATTALNLLDGALVPGVVEVPVDH